MGESKVSVRSYGEIRRRELVVDGVRVSEMVGKLEIRRL